MDHAPPFRARRAVSTVFFINGAVLASWVPHIPAVKARHAIGDGQLGFVLLCMALGAVLALPLAGWLVDRFGSRIMTSVAAVGFCLALPLPVISPNVAVLSLALALLGACNGALDVSMNAQAIVVERQYRRPIMSSFHGLFSLGGVVGAGTAGLAMSLGVGDSQHVALTALVSVCGMGWSLRWLVPSSPGDQRSDPVFARPTGRLLGLGLLAFGGLLAEGAMADWSAVYLHDALKRSPAVAAAAFAVFSLAMAAGRFGGDRLVGRLGPGLVLRASSAMAAGGLGVALLIGEPVAAILGFGVVGLGISNIIPVLFSSAGRLQGVRAGPALAAVATTGYFGFLAGPPLIGLAAEISNLTVALGIVSVFCALIAASADVVPRPFRVQTKAA